MAYERRYQVCLRVFEPLDAHPELGDYPVSDNRSMIEELVAADADARLISFPPDPVADSYRGTPIFLTAEEWGDGITRVCPVQDDIRSWHAVEALAENVSRDELDMLVPKSARRRAAAKRVEWMQDDPDERVFTRTAAWEVSPVWWLAFDLDADRIRIDEAEDGSQRTFIRTDIVAASARVDWALAVIREKSRLRAVVESTAQFGRWLETFDPNAVLELDLGGMTGVLDPAQAQDYVDSWVDALDSDDYDSAVAAFNLYTEAWEKLGLFSRSS